MFTHDFYYPKKRKTKDEIRSFLEKTEKQILYTVGYKWKSPTTYEVPISKEKAIDVFNKHKLITITEKESVVDINVFTTSDMW